MTFKRFSLMLALRIGLIMLGVTLLGWFLVQPGYHAATTLFAALVAGLGVEVYRFVERTNRELSRFFDAARYADFSQRFELGGVGAGFDDLGSTFADIMAGFRRQRSEQERELRHLKALVEHVPVPLISVRADDSLTLWNNPARRLFGTGNISHCDDLAPFGEEFLHKLRTVPPGERQLATFRRGEVERRMTLAVSELIIEGRPERLVSLQDIQGELDGMQLQAWQDLVRVLTHEIMNSITPVASLAKTSTSLLDDAVMRLQQHPDLVEELGDVRDAVATVSRRSDSLMEFVSGYRRLTQLPRPERATFRIAELFDSVTRLTEASLRDSGVRLTQGVEPAQLTLHADRGMIEQVLINLLQNAAQALQGREQAQVTLQAGLNAQGHVIISVSDNGAGVPQDLRHKIFVPFFTTRRDGSGVGLALSRQIMLAHGGAISLSADTAEGARFNLVF